MNTAVEQRINKVELDLKNTIKNMVLVENRKLKEVNYKLRMLIGVSLIPRDRA